jgi:hypothetical protein
MSASRWVHLSCVDVLCEATSSFLLRIGDEQYWIPKSHIADAGDYEAGDDDVKISITKWIAEQKGIDIS